MSNLFYEKVKTCKIYLKFDFKIALTNNVNTQSTVTRNTQLFKICFRLAGFIQKISCINHNPYPKSLSEIAN